MELVKIDAHEYGLTETKAHEIEAAFTPMLAKMSELENEYNAVIEKASNGIDEKVCAEAKSLRLKYVKVRTGTAEIHKQQKAYFLSAGRCVDGWKNAQLHASAGIEDKLSEIEKYYENLEAERIAKIKEERIANLSQYTDIVPQGIETMQDDVFDAYLNAQKSAYEARIEAERKAEAERIAKEKEEREEQERIRRENERLKAEAIEREKKEAAEHAERERLEKVRLEKERAEKAKRDAELRAIEEAARKEREEAARKLEAERAERERLEREKAEKERAEKVAREAEGKRLANIKHRKTIESGIVDKLSEFMSTDTAWQIVEAISNGDIDNLVIKY